MRVVYFLIAGGLILLGITVCIGWSIHSEAIITLIEGAVPMQFNTAVCFAALGASLLLVKFPRSSATVSLVPFVLGSLTLIEYSWDVSLGIDEMFMEHWHALSGDVPGRMAPNTSQCFVLCSIAIILFHAMSPRRRLPWVVAVGLSVFLVAGLASMGYSFDAVHAYRWGNVTAMAVHTAGGFLGASIALIVLPTVHSEGSYVLGDGVIIHTSVPVISDEIEQLKALSKRGKEQLSGRE